MAVGFEREHMCCITENNTMLNSTLELMPGGCILVLVDMVYDIKTYL